MSVYKLRFLRFFFFFIFFIFFFNLCIIHNFRVTCRVKFKINLCTLLVWPILSMVCHMSHSSTRLQRNSLRLQPNCLNKIRPALGEFSPSPSRKACTIFSQPISCIKKAKIRGRLRTSSFDVSLARPLLRAFLATDARSAAFLCVLVPPWLPQ